MAHQGYDLQLTRYDERGWRATFYTTGMEHSPTSATGTGWERTPWHATQRAAWEVLKPAEGKQRLVFDGMNVSKGYVYGARPKKLEAPDVKPNALLVAERRDEAFYDQLLLRDGLVASAANLAVGGITPESCHAP
jgi:hypothetical protein